MDRALSFMLVFFGGGLGCLVRLLLDGNTTNPITIANVSSCLLMGVSYALICYRVLVNKLLISFINVGFLGGLSTFGPLVLFALNTDMADNWLMTLLILLGQVVFFVVVSVIGYIMSVLILQHVLHKRRYLSRLVSARLLFAYKQIIPDFLKLQLSYLELKRLNIDLSVPARDPLLKEHIENLRKAAVNHLFKLVRANEIYIEILKKEKCVRQSFQDFTLQARENGNYLSATTPTYNEQMALIRDMRDSIYNFFPEFPLDALPDNLKGKTKSARLWDTLLESGNITLKDIPKPDTDAPADAAATAASAPASSHPTAKSNSERSGNNNKKKKKNRR